MSTDARRRAVPKLVEINDEGIPELQGTAADGDYVLADSDEEYIDENVPLPPNMTKATDSEEPEKLSERTEFIFEVLFWAMPFMFLFLLLDVLVRTQYAQQPELSRELLRVAKRSPCAFILTVLIIYIAWSRSLLTSVERKAQEPGPGSSICDWHSDWRSICAHYQQSTIYLTRAHLAK